jgi:hypothetical protein
MAPDATLFRLLREHLSPEATSELLDAVKITPALAAEKGDICSRAALAQALNLLLFADLIKRVPTAKDYFDDVVAADGRLMLDHGALRTVDFQGMGSLPAGESAIKRVLVPLGYIQAETYPLDRLGMTGRSYRHEDFAESIPQFFVSELHVERFSEKFQSAVARVTASSRDPLDRVSLDALRDLAEEQALGIGRASVLLANLVQCFTRRHDMPTVEDYEILLAESAEMAWISTEGNAFNHATDRVLNIEFVARRERASGRSMKDEIEVSRSGRIRQTAYQADPVQREFADGGGTVTRTVPGSFFEFIQRDRLPGGGGLDLSFDTGNAQGIFKMTAAAAA